MTWSQQAAAPPRAATAPQGVVSPPNPQGQVVPPPAVAPKKPVSSAQRVMRMSIVCALAAALVAVLGFVVALNQASGLDRASTRADRVLTVMAVRTALLEADGAATNAFLVGGLEPQARRMVYDQAIEEAATGLSKLAEGAREDSGLIAELNADLTRYTSLVEAARVNNRQGFPVGAAYLDQASTLVRDEMLADLDTVLGMAADDAAQDFSVGRWAVAVLLIVALALVVLVVCQVRLAKMTRRGLNPGLALATVLLIVGFVAGALGTTSSASTASDVRTDSYRPTLAVAQSAVLAAEARTLESFTLIKRGSGADYEVAFVDRTTSAAEFLDDTNDTLSRMLQEWVDLHGEIRALDDGGDWDAAVALAITDDAGSPSQAYAAFAEEAAAVVDAGQADVTDRLTEAAGSARVAAWLLLITGIIAAAASWRGLAPRREEYR